MKLTKRILSLCLALAMLLTVATFPAFAEEYTPKTVNFIRNPGTVSLSDGPSYEENLTLSKEVFHFILENDDLYVGDTIQFPASLLTVKDYTYNGTEVVTGISMYVQRVGTTSADAVKLNDTAQATNTSYEFTEPGTYIIYSNEYYCGDITHAIDLTSNIRYYFGLYEVKAKSDYGVVVPTPTTTKTEGDASTLKDAYFTRIKTRNSYNTGWQQTSILGSTGFSTGMENPTGEISDLTFEFNSVSYVKTVSFVQDDDKAIYQGDVYGSIDGKNWYLIADDYAISGTSVVWKKPVTMTITVNAVAKYVKINNLRTKYYGATTLAREAAATAVALAEGDYSTGTETPEEPTTVNVTLVNVDGVTANEVVTINEGATVTIPDAYATGYNFYADEECTEEVDLATETFDADTTIYVKAQTTTPDPEQPTGSKTIGLEASVRSSHARYDGALFLARPSDDVYVNDSLTIADNQTITIPANVYRGSSGAKIYLTSDTSNSDTIAQITGFEVIYGQNVNDMWHKAYVKVDANGVMSGFYSDATFATTKDITFTTAGTYLFGIQNYVDATGTLQNLKKISVSWDQFNSRDNSYMWAVNVKDPANQLVTAPNNADYDITSGTAIALDTNLIQGSAAVTATEGNLAYTEDIVPEGLTVDTRASDSYKDKNFTITKADNTATITGPASGLRIDFTDISYVGDLKIKRYQYDTDFKYDVYGSLDGETWYLIGDANRLGVRSGDSTYTISVDAVVKHLRVYYRDEVTACGYVTYNISAITGQIGVEYIGGGEEPAGPQVKDENDNVLFDEITNDVLKTLPSYFKVSGKNYVVKSWTMDGEAIDYAALKALTAADVTGDIVPVLVEVPFDVAKLSKDATKSDKDDTAFETGAKYVNGLYIQGAQIRFPETNVTAGLRFVNVVDRELEATLEALVEAGTISGLDHGTLAIGGVNYDNVDLTVDNTGVNNTGDKIYKTADLFDDEYYKYTLCVTGFQPAQYTLAVYVRPYITFTYGTETVYLYGEQYKTNYKAVVQEAVNVGGLSADELSYCNGILG